MNYAALNAPQHQAVTAPPQNQLVLAGAGSGKTRVLTCRIAWLCQQHAFSPMQILAVTFTNKAAREMRHRIEELLGSPGTGMWIGTFHSIAHRLLRRHAEDIGLTRNFTILDQDDQYQLVKQLIKAGNIDDKRYPPRMVQGFINTRKDEGERAATVAAHSQHYDTTLVNLYQAYEKKLAADEAVDFADLLLYTCELFQNNAGVRQHYQQRFQAILVDEFQDTNKIQYQWLTLLYNGENSVTAVGDDDQSIYGWRGARVENVNYFTRDFSPVETIRLEQNYRSTQTILSAANAVIENNEERLGKNLWTHSGSGEKIDLYDAINEREEADFIVSRIQKALAAGRQHDDFAILYRSNAQSRVLEEALLKADIPYRIYGGLRFFERAEIKDALAYLRLIQFKGDNMAFERIVNVPARGLGAKSMDKVRDVARQHNIGLWEAARQAIDQGILSTRPAKALAGFLSHISAMENALAHLKLGDQVRYVIEQSGLMTYYREGRHEKAAQKVDNLKELVTAASEFTPTVADIEDNQWLAEFLSFAVLESGERQAEADIPSVQLMTLHSAKGLEFPYVFISGLEDGLFPSSRALASPEQLAEERRLCYVGMTRAMEKLTLSYARSRHQYGEINTPPPSRFLREIPEHTRQNVRLGSGNRSKPFGFGMSPRAFLKGGSSQQHPDTALQEGDQVSHPKFGIGVIERQVGEGDKQQYHVAFGGRQGTKVLLAKFARLEKV